MLDTGPLYALICASCATGAHNCKGYPCECKKKGCGK
jgi:hypothetical protein